MSLKRSLLGGWAGSLGESFSHHIVRSDVPSSVWTDQTGHIDGLPTIGAGKRGLVLCPPVTATKDSIRSHPFDRQHLTSAMLFWDSIVYPTNRVIRVGSDEINSLVKMGCVHEARITPKVPITGDTSILLSDPGFVFEHLERASPTRWSLSRQHGALAPRSDDLQTHSGALLGLLNCIPVPPREVAFEDILEFKAHRSDELLALRAHLDEFASAITSAGDVHGAFTAKVDLIDRALADQLKVTNERFGLANLITLNLGFSLTDAFRAAAAAIAPLLGAGVGILPSVTSAAAAGIGAGISIDANAGSLKSGGQAKPFQYIVNAHREL